MDMPTKLQQGIVGLTAGNAGSLAVAHIALGFLVLALVAALGGPTGPGLNPARDLGHHQLVPLPGILRQRCMACDLGGRGRRRPLQPVPPSA